MNHEFFLLNKEIDSADIESHMQRIFPLAALKVQGVPYIMEPSMYHQSLLSLL
jgi:hypothetical protein